MPSANYSAVKIFLVKIYNILCSNVTLVKKKKRHYNGFSGM